MKHFPHSTLTNLQATQTGGQTNLTLQISIVPSFGGLIRASGLTTFVKWAMIEFFCYLLLLSGTRELRRKKYSRFMRSWGKWYAPSQGSLLHQYSTFFKVLWLGNSYTFYNDLPIMVARLATAQGKSILYSNHTESSWSWKSHAESQLTMELIRSQPWDVVVLQEQSRKPAYPPQTVCDDSIRHLASLVVAIKANNPETVLQVSKISSP